MPTACRPTWAGRRRHPRRRARRGAARCQRPGGRSLRQRGRGARCYRGARALASRCCMLTRRYAPRRIPWRRPAREGR
jgi:hypothetical protein